MTFCRKRRGFRVHRHLVAKVGHAIGLRGEVVGHLKHEGLGWDEHCDGPGRLLAKSLDCLDELGLRMEMRTPSVVHAVLDHRHIGIDGALVFPGEQV